MIEIYTDGACRGNPGKGGWSFFVNNTQIIHYGFLKDTTNNIAELTAIHQAFMYILQNINSDKKIIIFSDSLYSINVIKGLWRIKKNRKLIYNIKKLVLVANSLGMNIEFKKVKGHSGIMGNELADKGANLAIDFEEDGIITKEKMDEI
jgi:ribonuclease HI